MLGFYLLATDSGAHPTSYPVGTGLRRPRCEVDHSHPSSAEVKNTWSYTSTAPYVSMAWYFVKYGDNFTLPLYCLCLHRSV